MKTTRFALFSLIAFLFLASPAQAAGESAEPGSSADSSASRDAAGQILELVNRDRTAAGLDSLALDQEAAGIAAEWSRRMAMDGRISHNAEYLGDETFERLNAIRLGENVAVASSLEEVHDLFMQSPPHRGNILEPGFRLIGVGAFRSDAGQLYLTEDFLTRRPASPPEAETRVEVPTSAPMPVPASPRPRPVPPAPPASPARTRAVEAPPAAPVPVPSPPVPTEVAVTPDTGVAPESPDRSDPDPAPRGSSRHQAPLGDLLKGAPGLALLRRRAARRYY